MKDLKDLLEGFVILLGIALSVYLRVKLWTYFFPNDDYFPFLGPKKIQMLFGDENKP